MDAGPRQLRAAGPGALSAGLTRVASADSAILFMGGNSPIATNVWAASVSAGSKRAAPQAAAACECASSGPRFDLDCDFVGNS